MNAPTPSFLPTVNTWVSYSPNGENREEGKEINKIDEEVGKKKWGWAKENKGEIKGLNDLPKPLSESQSFTPSPSRFKDPDRTEQTSSDLHIPHYPSTVLPSAPLSYSVRNERESGAIDHLHPTSVAWQRTRGNM